MSVGHLANKFNIVSNDPGHMQKCNFLEYQFWANLKIFQILKVKFGIQTNLNM